MANQNDASDDEVELTSLITNNGGGVHADDDTGASTSPTQTQSDILADTAPPHALRSSGYSISDFLGCLGIIAVIVLLVGISSKKSPRIGVGLHEHGLPQNNTEGIFNNGATATL